MTGAAVLTPDGVYRYSLTRELDPVGRDRILWIMLNPSIADADIDDATILTISAFSRLWGFSRLEVVNVWAVRSTDPRLLATHPDPVGPDNDAYIADGLARADFVMAAWGVSYPPHMSARPRQLGAELRRDGLAHILGMTKVGEPRHPLYVPRNTQPRRWVAE